MKDRTVYTLKLSRHQLIHLRRFLVRGVDCAQGTCHPKLSSGWYYVEPLLNRIQDILERKPNNKVSGPEPAAKGTP